MLSTVSFMLLQRFITVSFNLLQAFIAVFFIASHIFAKAILMLFHMFSISDFSFVKFPVTISRIISTAPKTMFFIISQVF